MNNAVKDDLGVLGNKKVNNTTIFYFKAFLFFMIRQNGRIQFIAN
jgi:hypothetical protein